MNTKIQNTFKMGRVRLPWLLAMAVLGCIQTARAQFDYTDNGDGTCTITKYTGSSNNVAIPDSTNGLTVTAIGDSAFAGQNITNVTIPDSVTSIGDYAFAGCTSLTSVTIPDSVTSIGNEAFYYTRLMDAAISANVTNIGSGAFAACSDLTAITVDAANPFYSSVNGVLFDKNQDALVQYPGQPAGVYAVPDGVTNISGEAFEGAGLTNVIMAGSVTNIGGYAFYSCSSLTAIYFLGNAPGADSHAFDGDSALTLYYLPGSTNWTSPFDGIPAVLYSTAAADFDYATNSDNATITITSYIGINNVVVIPDTINGLPVTSIGNEAFVFCTSLTSVTIPDSVTSIGNEAFYYTRLMDAAISANVTNIGSGAFAACSDLTAISVDAANPFYSSVNGILFDKNQDALVQYPGGLGLAGSYAVPAGVINISGEAFEGAGLTNVIMAGSVTNIGGYAFYSCSSLTAIYFQGNAPGADSHAFDGDSALTLYYLPGATGWTSPFDGIPAVLWNPQATAFSFTGGQYGFNIIDLTNAAVVVEATTNLADPVWIPVSTNLLPGSGVSAFSDPQSGNYSSRFYRFHLP